MPRTNVRATRYAQAAFPVARRENQIEAWITALDSAAELFQDRRAGQVLTSPVIPPDRKLAALRELLPGVPSQVSNFLGILAHRDRLELIPGVAAQFRRLANEERGIAVAQVTTAIALDQAQRDLIAARLSARIGRQIMLEERVDPSILGGVVAQIGDDVIDGSVRGRLERLRRRLTA